MSIFETTVIVLLFSILLELDHIQTKEKRSITLILDVIIRLGVAIVLVMDLIKKFTN